MRPPELVRVFKGHTGSVSAAAFHPAMHQMISGSHDGRLYVWHFKQQLRPFKFEPASSDLGGQNQGHKADVNDVSVAKDGSFFASASSDKTVSLWLNNAKGTPSHVIKAHTGVVRSCHLSPDNSLLATASDDKIVKIWQVTPTSAKFVMSLEGHTHWVRSVRFSQDEPNLVVTCGDDKTVRIWDLRIAGAGAHSAGGGKDRGCVMKMQEHSERVNRAIFHPDGTCIASGSDDRTIKIWDLRRKRLIQHYDAHGAAVLDLDFCHSQNFLASASADRSVKIWDLQEGRLLYTLAGHEDAVGSVKFSPQGQFLVSGSGDSKLFVWKTGQCPSEQLYEQPPSSTDVRGGAARTYLYNAPRAGNAIAGGEPATSSSSSSAAGLGGNGNTTSSSSNVLRPPSRTASTKAGGAAGPNNPKPQPVITQFAGEVNSDTTLLAAHSTSPVKKKRGASSNSNTAKEPAVAKVDSGITSRGTRPTSQATGPGSAGGENKKEGPTAAEQKMMEAIQQMTAQMEMLMQTVKVMDQRLSMTEATVAQLAEKPE